ncbi:ACP S-malonyltransferase [Microcella daejeonensis]|uniref:ACP S-malonyltransferase n=1 Tax=Microcella daejeonensis TaxID=2994971 RepID=UPI002270340C|nr:ACP S-malonyltransferase [Microcella daejeonensis]WAB83273.1 ACP S-malonyltransferase [Microcella daejeonensis]
MIVVVAPGQGSQTPGFLEPWVADPAHRARLESFGEAAGLDLVAHGTTFDADTIRDTAIAQPLIVAASLLSAAALLEGRADRVGAVAGHSVGEFAAAAIAGVMTEQEALALVRQRGLAMAEAAALVPTGMSAVLGGDADALAERLVELGLEPANVNGGGQTVVAGELNNLEALAADPVRGSRVIPLQVAGAFHTSYMRPAVDRVRSAAAAIEARAPRIRLYTNHDGTVVTDGARAIELLVGQVASPVRWDLCMESMAADGVTGIIELLPAGALTGLAKRGLKGVPTVAVKTPDDLPAAIEMLENA